MDHGMSIIRDIQFTLRTLRKNPAFALSVVLAVGLSIGANTAVLSVVDGVLLQPLRFPQSGRLVNV